MVDAGQVRRFAAKAVIWKWALGIGVGAACAGVVVAVGHDRLAPPAAVVSPVADLSPPIEATGTASIGGTPLTTASLDLPIIESPPAMMLPPDKPPAPPRSAVSKVFRVREPATAGVAHFSSCLPSCETRDPQLVGLEPADSAQPASTGPIPPAPIPPAAVRPPQEADAMPAPPPRRKDVLDRAVDGSKHLARKVEQASDSVVRGTKRAFNAAVDLVW